MKKMLIFATIVLVILGGLAFMNNMKKTDVPASTTESDNPFKKEKLDPATIAQLSDPNYQNQITDADLRSVLEKKGTAIIYFYGPTCPPCKQTSPIIVPMAKEMNVDLKLFNMLEFESGWDDYRIEGTPTVIAFKNGKEVDRIVGYNEKEVFKAWFEKVK